MIPRNACSFMQLKLFVKRAELYNSSFWCQSTKPLQFHSTRLSKPPAVFISVRTKSSAITEDLSVIRGAWNKIFGKYLLATNVISSGVLMAIGDLIAQEIRNRRCLQDKREYDLQRLWRMFIVGCLQGPLHHYVYRWMDKVMPVRSLKNVTRKISIDQFVLSPICILMFFYPACFLEEKTLEEANAEIVQKFPFIYITDWCFWPAVQYINFRFLDTKYRVMYVNVMTAIYNVFMSFMKHEFDTGT